MATLSLVALIQKMCVVYRLCVAEQDGLVCAGAEHFDLSVVLRELDGSDGAGVVVKGLEQTVALLHIKDMNQAVTAGRGQQLWTYKQNT